ncbi:hypothetical protein HA402_010425 [Bradysia odoriphaga]|nr:hypothetical protein HA402_010425 [Bradysia odoriphaga]
METVFRRNNRHAKRLTKSQRADITFPVSRVHRHLRKRKYVNRIRVYSAVYLAVVLEYLVAETLELAGNEAKEQKRKRIVPRHIMLAIRKDGDLSDLLKEVMISFSGVVPNIQAPLLVQKK